MSIKKTLDGIVKKVSRKKKTAVVAEAEAPVNRIVIPENKPISNGDANSLAPHMVQGK